MPHARAVTKNCGSEMRSVRATDQSVAGKDTFASLIDILGTRASEYPWLNNSEDNNFSSIILSIRADKLSVGSSSQSDPQWNVAERMQRVASVLHI